MRTIPVATSADNLEHLPTRDASSADLGDVVGQAIPRASDRDEAWASAAFLPPHVAGYTLAQDVPLGRGGGGTVWLFRPIAGGDLVVIKVPRPEALAGDGRARFERECEKLLKLRHENVVRAREAVQAVLADGGRVPALVMEYVSGELLSEYLERAAPSRRELLELFERLCGAVAALHHVGLVHLDLKPANIKIRATAAGPVPVILDLGSSRVLLDREMRHSGLTLTFASPEQLEQHERGSARLVDTSSDVYSLAKILAWLLGGDDAVEAPRAIDGPEQLRWLHDWSPRRMAGLVRRCDPRILRVIADATRPAPVERLRAWRRSRERTSTGTSSEHATARDLRDAIALARQPWWRRLRHRWSELLEAVPVPARRVVNVAALATTAGVVGACASSLVKLASPPLTQPWLTTVAPFEHVRTIIFPYDLTPARLRTMADALGAMTPDPEAWPTWRSIYGRIGELCALAGADVVGFDLEIGRNAAAAPFTADLVDSVRRMRDLGCESVFGLADSWTAEPPPHHFEPALADVGARHGCLRVGFEALPARVVLVPVRAERERSLSANSFAAELMLARLRARSARNGAVERRSAARFELRLAADGNVLNVLGPSAPNDVGVPSSDRLSGPRPAALTGTIEDFASIAEKFYRGDPPPEPGRLRLGAGDRVGMLMVDLPPRPVLASMTITAEELLAMSPERRAEWLGSKVVLLANTTPPRLTGGFEAIPDVARDRWSSPEPTGGADTTAPIEAMTAREAIERAPWIPRVWIQALAAELLISPPAAAWRPRHLIASMLLASVTAVLVGGRLAGARTRWARSGEPLPRARAARRTVVVTLVAVGAFLVAWGVLSRLGVILPYDIVNVVLAGAAGLLVGWLAARIRALSNSFDAWLEESAALRPSRGNH